MAFAAEFCGWGRGQDFENLLMQSVYIVVQIDGDNA